MSDCLRSLNSRKGMGIVLLELEIEFDKLVVIVHGVLSFCQERSRHFMRAGTYNPFQR